MNTKIVIGRVVLALLLLSQLAFAGGTVPIGVPPKDKEEETEEDDPPMKEEPVPPKAEVTFTFPSCVLSTTPGFPEFIRLVAEGGVDEVREILKSDVDLAQRYLYGQVLFTNEGDGIAYGCIALDIAAFQGDDATAELLIDEMGADILLERHPIDSTIDLDRLDYLSNVLAVAARHEKMRWALLGDANRVDTITDEGDEYEYLIGMNGLDLAVIYGTSKHVALILEFIEAHEELADWFIPDRRHQPNLGTPLKFAAVHFKWRIVELLLGSRFADRFYVNPELIVNAWMHLPLSRKREALRLLLAQVIIRFKPEFAIVHEHEYLEENAVLNRNINELRRVFVDDPSASFSPAILRNILKKLKEFYSDDILGRLIDPYTDFLNQLVNLQREVQTESFWGRTVEAKVVNAAQNTIGSLIGYLRPWLEKLRAGVIQELVVPVYGAMFARELGQPWKRR